MFYLYIYKFIMNRFIIQIFGLILYGWILSFYWDIRINHTFRGSVYEIPKIFNIFTYCFIGISGLICLVLLCVYVSKNVWISQNNYCYTKWESKELLNVVITIEILILFWNFIFTFLFYQRLKAFANMNKKNNERSNTDMSDQNKRYFQVLQKHILLTMIMFGNTVICVIIIFNLIFLNSNIYYYSIFLFIDLDIFIKTFSTILYFKFFEKLFSKACLYCIRCLSLCGDNVSKQYFPYLRYKKTNSTRNLTIFDVNDDDLNTNKNHDMYFEDADPNIVNNINITINIRIRYTNKKSRKAYSNDYDPQER